MVDELDPLYPRSTEARLFGLQEEEADAFVPLPFALKASRSALLSISESVDDITLVHSGPSSPVESRRKTILCL